MFSSKGNRLFHILGPVVWRWRYSTVNNLKRFEEKKGKEKNRTYVGKEQNKEIEKDYNSKWGGWSSVYLKVPKSNSKYPKVPQSALKYPKVSQSTPKYLTVPKSTSQYPKVPQSTQKYLKVHKST